MLQYQCVCPMCRSKSFRLEGDVKGAIIGDASIVVRCNNCGSVYAKMSTYALEEPSAEGADAHEAVDIPD